ncbi:beta-fructofuranosidase [Halobacillus karajensis]|uniref:glycoside hydrolase family 32 protein n=1 Tax=Halobacillus karajensis TaxID=195088 RepID=UPI0008A737EB|nr:glycoside hydrolase family 32 protein [Halobacillus karajensis]SEI13995.1 beta-fructofuranosidase [Halobacillus karajensis]
MNHHKKEIEKANTFVEKKLNELEARSFQPVYHFTAPVGWLNDPNGLIQHQGTYHLFYQFHPYSEDWGPMHWGHATSKDLVNWDHQPVALAPSEDYDKGKPDEGYGCFSGSAVVKDDRLILIFTGHIDSKQPKEVQCIATTEDGTRFEKSPANPVISQPPESLSSDFRDPKVWFHEGLWYMVVGTSEAGRGGAALFKSEDLMGWSYCGLVAQSDGKLGDMWECPDLFPIQEKHALIVSPMNMNDGKNIILVGDMNYEQHHFVKDYFVEVDEGFDFYAAQTFLDEKGRRILIAWMDQWGTDFPTKKEGWAGAMTIPREITLNEKGEVRFLPVEELQFIRNEHERHSDVVVSNDFTPDMKGQSLEIKATFDLSNSNSDAFGIHVLKSEDGEEYTEIKYCTDTGEVMVDLNKAGKVSGVAIANIQKREELSLHIYIDRCSVEVFINDGEKVITNRVYPDSKSDRVEVFADQPTNLNQFNIWKLDKS